MPRTPILAAGEAMPASEPSLYRLISLYWERYDLLNQAMRAADAVEDGDSEESAVAEAAQSEASDRLDEAGMAVLAFVPTWIIEAKVKHSFVTGMMDREGGRLDTDQLDALVSSMADLYQPRRAA